MRLARSVFLTILLTATVPSLAQEDPKADELKKMYDNAMSQLKSVQDRRNELAQANDALNARVKELEAKLATTEAELDTLRKDAAAYAEKTFYLRSHYAAWQGFLQVYPEIVSRWKTYLGSGLTLPKPTQPADDNWPFDMEG
jgi:septal ring factor EnvC (AmiA/AmiB activator)